MASENFQNYYRVKIDDDDDDDDGDDDYNDNDEDDASEGISFKNKAKIIRNTKVRPPWPTHLQPQEDGTQASRQTQLLVPHLKTEDTILLKFNNFWILLDLSSMSCEVELDLLWTNI